MTVLPGLPTKISSDFFVVVVDANDANSKNDIGNKLEMLFFSIDLILTHIRILAIFDLPDIQTRRHPCCDVT